MPVNKKSSRLVVFLMLTFTAIFLSCDIFKDTDNYDVSIVFICSGGTGTDTGKFDVTILTDGKYQSLLPISNLVSQAYYPAGKITTATITATRKDSTDTLMIMVYVDRKLDSKGFSYLPSCTSGTSTTTTYCSNTLSMAWKYTPPSSESVSGSTSSSSTSSTSSSTSSTSSSTSSSSTSSSSGSGT